MSLGGLVDFNKNLLKLMDSPAFKKSDDSERLKIRYALIKSKYGGAFGGKVEPLPEPKK